MDQERGVVFALSPARAQNVGMIALAVACSGCAESHTPSTIEGVDADERLADLDDGDWTALCAWLEQLRGDEPLLYRCEGTNPIPVDASPRNGFYDWTAHFCYEARLGERSLWTRFPPECGETVAEWVACWRTRAELVCYAMHEFTPECRWLTECWVSGGRDAGSGG